MKFLFKWPEDDEDRTGKYSDNGQDPVKRFWDIEGRRWGTWALITGFLTVIILIIIVIITA